MSQNIHAVIDDDVYLALKSQKANISKMIRDALKVAVITDFDEEEQELKRTIDECQKVIQEQTKILSETSMKLSILTNRKEQDNKEKMEKAMAMHRALRAVNHEVLNFD